MKAIYLHTIGALALSFTLAACVSSIEPPAPAPAPVATPSPTPTPTPPPVVQEPVYKDYLDAPQTPGDWSYGASPAGTSAIFSEGRDFAGGDTVHFIIGCDRSRPEISLVRSVSNTAQSPGLMTITTETAVKQLRTSPPDSSQVVAVRINARDPILDAMAITKGRIAIAVEGERTLYLPAWVEISRVIEDCR